MESWWAIVGRIILKQYRQIIPHPFIEINPRTRIAAGATLGQLGFAQDRISTRGFAIQCRITTDGPAKNFQPDTGKIEVYGQVTSNSS